MPGWGTREDIEGILFPVLAAKTMPADIQQAIAAVRERNDGYFGVRPGGPDSPGNGRARHGRA